MKETDTIKLKNHLVPEHIKLNEEEKKQVLEKYNVSLVQMPSIRQTDPAIKHLNTMPGDLIKITRNSPTRIKTEFFRVVING